MTGDSTYWAGLLHGLSSIDREFEYLFLSTAPAPESVSEWVRQRWKVLPGRNERFWSLATLPLAVRRLGNGLLHTQYNVSPLIGKRGVTTIHDVSFFVGPEWFKPKDRFLLRRGVPESARRAGRVITVSETSRRDIERFVPSAKGKISVTPLAAGLGISRVDQATARARVDSELGIDGPYVLTIGTRWPRKNLKLAVDAFKMMPTGLGYRLIVTGKAGWGEEGAGSDSIIYPGYVSDDLLSNLLSGASLFLMPSFYEGFGIPVLEAFECGCPVVVSSGGSLPEVAGSAAVVMDSWEAAKWAAAMQSLLGDSGKLRTLSEAGRERIAGFSWTETARLTEAAYKEALK